MANLVGNNGVDKAFRWIMRRKICRMGFDKRRCGIHAGINIKEEVVLFCPKTGA